MKNWGKKRRGESWELFSVWWQHSSLSCQKKLLNEKGDGTKDMEKYEQLEAMFKQWILWDWLSVNKYRGKVHFQKHLTEGCGQS